MNCVSSCWENVHAAKQKRPEDKQGFQSCVLEFTSVFFHSTDLIQEYLRHIQMLAEYTDLKEEVK